MSAIPDLIKIGSIPGDMEMSVDSDILEPVVKSNSFCRFTLMNKGFMNSFSKIVIGCNAVGGTAGEHTYPINVGISSVLERATLKVGAKTISQTEDFGHFMGYKSLFIDNEVNRQREQVISGRAMAFELRYNNGSGNFSDFNASKYGLSNGKCYIQQGRQPLSTDDEGLMPYIWQQLKNTPEFQISLADLFPFLRYNSLPLYMFDEQISIELTFNTQSAQRQSGATTLGAMTIKEDSLKLIADYIFYDGDTMEQFSNANANMNFQYVDYQLNKRTLSQTQAQGKNILNVGGAGRIVPKLHWSISDNANTNVSLFNVYHAQAPDTTTTDGARNMGIMTTNVRFNDKYLYPLDRVSNAIHFHDVSSAEASQPNTSRDIYSRGGSGLTTEAFNGLNQSVNMSGKQYYQANRLNRNERINSRGVELECKFSAVANKTYTHRAWIEVVRQAQLSDGILDTTYA